MNKGYVALSSILVILAVMTIIGLSVSLLSISEIQQSLAEKKSQQSLNLAESCLSDTLLALNRDGSLPSSVVLPEGSCSVALNSQTGDDYNFTITTQSGSFQKMITIDATRETGVTITSWQEN
jgi:hypothetical protein